MVAGPRRLKLEVKTKTASGVPQPHYYNTVDGANARQQADASVFLHVVWNHKRSTGGVLLFCGAMPCARVPLPRC